ncbi:MAG TPA: uracil-DNA glycosylase [Terriglobales bacterium]|nr:uracil-DNA glycosylase [Terriglobales bacterium]
MGKSAAEVLACLRDHVELLDGSGAGFCLADPGPAAPMDAAAAPDRGQPAAPSAGLAADTRTAAEIERDVRSCKLCPLHRQRTNAVPGEGNWAAEVMFIGEAPGRDEDLQGRPFVGRAGQLLRKIIASMKFREDEVYITNMVKCRPPENRVPHREEMEACWPYLARQVEIIKPKVIVTLGMTPTGHFVPGRTSMGQLRGRFADYKGIPLMPTFHPSYLIRNEGNREIRRMVWEDMKKVMALLGRT